MDPIEISKLAKLLKDNGDKVLNSEFKLSLSGSLLKGLCDSFTLIVDDNEILPVCGFQVTKINNSKHTDVFRELQFIHDFVQKTVVLSLTNFLNEDLFDGPIDISKFRNLRTLEIQKLSIKRIVGIQQLRAQLKEIICIRCIANTREIISDCGGDNSNGFIWNELKRLDLSYNTLEKVDSFEFTPYVQYLNLSHNQISNVSAIKWLPNLKILNLSYNQLSHIPKFNTETYRRLQVLVINDNFIEDISGLDRMLALAELDLSGNCILDHSMLLPLSTLSALCYLNLLGNPLACHPKHRVATARYLNKNAASMKFLLDKYPLSNQEKSLAGSFEHYYPIFGNRLNSISNRSSSQNTPTPSVKSVSSTPENSSFSSMSSLIHQQEPKIIEEQSCSIGQQRKIRARPVIISEITEITEDTKMVVKKDLKELPGLEGNKEHLETKLQIEQLRAMYGNEWLQSQGASMVQNVMGLEESMNQEKLDKNYDHLFFSSPTRQIESSKNTKENIKTSTPIDTTLDDSNSSGQTIYQSVLDTTGSAAYTTAEDDTVCVENEEIVISDAEENESKFLAFDNRTDEEFFLVVSEENIKEKETMTGRTKTRWGMKTLESCDRIKSNVIRLNFDTIRKDKKERIYRMEKECCQELEKILREIMASRPLSEMNQVLYKCAKCNTQFSREVNPQFNKKNEVGDLRCPECKNIYVIVISNQASKGNVEAKQVRPSTSSNSLMSNLPITIENKRVDPIKVSQSQSSIGSATSLNSSSCSKISSSFNSNQSVAGSTNSDRDKDADLMSRGGNESDVEILSNPSQSSIEVLDADSISQNLAMDRRFSVDAIDDESIATNFDINLMLNQEIKSERVEKLTKSKVSKKVNDKLLLGTGTFNLTESSSSGSVTDSVCTTYEQNKSSMSKSNDSTKSPTEESKSKDSTGLGSMLGGLFQSTNLLLAKTPKKDVESTIQQPFEKIQYFYDDLSIVDHRLKLYLFQALFEDVGENLVWLVKGHIVDDECVGSGAGAYSGMVILSSTKFYVLKECGSENEEINTWLKKSVSGTVDRIEQIRALPWKIGVSFKIKGIASIHLILQDVSRTDNALYYFNNHIPSTCTIEYQVHPHLQKKLKVVTNDEPVKSLSVFKSCEFVIDNIQKIVSLGSLIVTDTELILLKSDFQWICDDSVKNYETYGACISTRQQMTNLIELDNLSENAFNFNFMDETENKFETWKFVFDDKTCAVDEVLKTVSDIWQKIFHVPLINSS